MLSIISSKAQILICVYNDDWVWFCSELDWIFITYAEYKLD